MKATRNGKTSFDADRILKAGTAMRKLAAELAEIFPEREDLIQQIILALATRNNVLIWGLHGTGKTDLVQTLFAAFTGASVFSVAMDKYMTHADIFGVPNPKKLREDGEIIYPTKGLLEADCLEVDEFFDANDAVLRTFLGVLNERQFKRGRQVEKANLHTAIASTNGTPAEELRRRPTLVPVVDRLLFHSHVNYLTARESRLRMYHKYLAGELPETVLPFAELQYLAGVVNGANQITDETFISAYEEMVEAFGKAVPDKVVSDRRKCKLLELVEAEALLNGRYEVHPEDLQAVRWGICASGARPEHEAFKKVSGPIIEKAAAEMKSPIDTAEVALLRELEAKVPAVPDAQTASDALVQCARALTEVSGKVAAVKPQLATTRELQAGIGREIAKRSAAVQGIVSGKG